MDSPSGQQVITLTERLSNTVESVGKLETKIDSLNISLNALVSLPREMNALSLALETRTAELIKADKDHEAQLNTINQQLAINKSLAKLAAWMASTLCAGSVALAGWLYNRVENTNKLEYRMETLETWAQSRAPSIIPPIEPQRSTRGKS